MCCFVIGYFSEGGSCVTAQDPVKSAFTGICIYNTSPGEMFFSTNDIVLPFHPPHRDLPNPESHRTRRSTALGELPHPESYRTRRTTVPGEPPHPENLKMRSSIRSSQSERKSLDICGDTKDCTCVVCYFKYVHRIWFALQTRLLVMYALRDKEMFTKTRVDKFASDAEEAAKCRDKFMAAQGIVCDDKKKQKRKAYNVKDSSACAFGTLQDLFYTWYNMDVTLPQESYRHASTRAPDQHHPLPYLPTPLRFKLYPSLASERVQAIKQMCQYVGALPPHPRIMTEIHGRPVELSVLIKIKNHNCRRVEIEVYQRFLDEESAAKTRLSAEEMKVEVVSRLVTMVRREMKPAYMRPQAQVTLKPEENLRDTSLRAQDLDYVNHNADPGTYKHTKAISGTVTATTLISLFQQAEMGPEAIFLDIGSGMGEPMIAAATGFQVQLSLGLEVHKNRVEASLRSIIDKGVSRAFPIHVSVEEICHFDPVTHVYCYTNGMDATVRNCIRESILASKSVRFVLVDRKDLLRYDAKEEDVFKQVSKPVTLTMAGSSGSTRTFYVLKRVGEHMPRHLEAEVTFHPIFALPIYSLRFDRDQEQAFLVEYLYMLSRVDYKPLYCCVAKSTKPRVSATKRKRSPPPPLPYFFPTMNCFYSAIFDMPSATEGDSAPRLGSDRKTAN